MASLTPGVLSKLVENAGNRDVKFSREHRSALLQVIGIVPALAGVDDDPLQSRGFFLKVSDSLHSTYVSISDEDSDLIFSDKIQLGQFVHVSRLDSGNPVPVLRGLKPVPRRHACIGNPKDLNANVDLVCKRSEKNDENAKKKKKKKEEEDLKRKMKKSLEIEDEKKLRRNERMEILETRRLSLDTTRRGWDRSTGSKKNGVKSPSSAVKWMETSSSSDFASVLSDMKPSSRSDSSLKNECTSKSLSKSRSNGLTQKNVSKPLQGDAKQTKEATVPCQLVKVPLIFRNRSEQSISWELLPTSIHDSGKEAICYRDAAFLAAVDALQEASAAEGVIRCMSLFSEVCSSAQQVSPGMLVENFLDLHQSMQQVASVVDALVVTRFPEARTSPSYNSQLPSPELHQVFVDKNVNATSWVKAALETDLSRISLLSDQENKGNQAAQRHYVVIETPAKPTEFASDHPHKKSSHKNYNGMQDFSAKGGPSPKRPLVHSGVKKTTEEKLEWCRGKGLKEVANVAERLLLVSRGWFLKYLEDFLNNGLGLREKEGDCDVTCLLGQLKRVNQWLDDATGNKFEVDERVERLRKKLYAFLLEHVDSTINVGIVGEGIAH